MSQAERTGTRATLVLVIGARQVEGALLESGANMAWRAGSGFAHAIAAGGGDPLAALNATLQALPALAGVHGRCQMRVLVAETWLGTVTLPWSDAMRERRAALGHARARLGAAGFSTTAADTLRIDDAPFGVPRLALAYPAGLLAALAQLAARNAASLVSVLPLTVAGWNAAQRERAPRPVLALAGAGILAIARTGGGRLQELTVRAASGTAAPAQEMRQLWQRQCLRDPQLVALGEPDLLDLGGSPGQGAAWGRVIDLPKRGPVAEGVAPTASALALAAAACSGRHDPLDAIGTGRKLSRPRRVALGAAAVLACAALGHALHAGLAARALQARLDVPHAVVAAPRVPAWSPMEATRVGAVNVAIRELNLPFDALLRALAPGPDLRVAVLSVTTAASSSAAAASSVKIVAEARTGADMARYAAFVAERKPFVGAYLVEHQLDETSPERPYRFTLEATWKD